MKCAFADIGAVLGDAVIIARDGARADIGALADPCITDIGEMIGLRASLDRGLFHFDKVADVHILAEVSAGSQSSERTDARVLADMRTLKMRERTDRCAVIDRNARAENDVRFDRYVLAEFGVGRKNRRFPVRS